MAIYIELKVAEKHSLNAGRRWPPMQSNPRTWAIRQINDGANRRLDCLSYSYQIMRCGCRREAIFEVCHSMLAIGSAQKEKCCSNHVGFELTTRFRLPPEGKRFVTKITTLISGTHVLEQRQSLESIVCRISSLNDI